MREFVFRAWDVQSHEYFPNVQTHIGNFETAFGNMLKNNRYVIEQFVGVKDEFGKNIFEGDIVKHNGLSHNYPMLIFFRDGSFCIGSDGSGPNEWGSWVTIRDLMTQAKRCGKELKLTVIGNIHENPEITIGGVA